MFAPRSPVVITLSVWKAIFLRETVTRLSAGRAAWLWLLLEPLAHLAFLMVLFGFIFHRIISGVDGAMFIVTGLLGFFMASKTALQCMEAINANSALFTYRQVLPVDTVLMRALLEGFLMLMTMLLLLAGAGLFGYQVIPHDPLLVLAAMAGLWLSGAGLGLMLSVLGELVPELARLARIAFRPLYFISGVMIPAIAIPQPYRSWLLFNPFLNGLEALRAGFFPQFTMAPEASLLFVYGFAVVTIFLGLALHVRFTDRMVMQ